MNPSVTRLAFLALVLAFSLPALAAGEPWGSPAHWKHIDFLDPNGQPVTLWVSMESYRETPGGQALNLYALTEVNWAGKYRAYQAVLSKFQGRMQISQETMQVLFPSYGLPPSRVERRAVGISLPETKFQAEKSVGALAPGPGETIVVYRPIEDPKPISTLFPECLSPGASVDLEGAARGGANPSVFNVIGRRFLPLELGLQHEEVRKALAVPSTDNDLYRATDAGDYARTDDFAQKSRAATLDKVKAAYEQISAARKARPASFDKLEGDLLWAYARYSGKEAEFIQQVQAALPEGNRKAFVAKYRQMVLSELIAYRDEAVPLLAQKGLVDGPFQKSREGIIARVAKTIAGDDAQLRLNAAAGSSRVLPAAAAHPHHAEPAKPASGGASPPSKIGSGLNLPEGDPDEFK